MVDFGKKAQTPAAKQNSQCLHCHESNAAHNWASSAHAASGLACASCHTLHAAKDPVRAAMTQIEVCTSCHQAQHADLNTLSRHPLREGKMACTSCHTPHGSTAPAQLVRNTVNETCTSCHSEYRGPFLWEHQPVAEDCSNCHDAHGSVQPALLKLRPPFLCQACHAGAGHPSFVSTPQNLPGGASPSAYLLAGGCINCHSQIHGSNHPSGQLFMR
jgi:DmsE family decaheme c-type cytochrome